VSRQTPAQEEILMKTYRLITLAAAVLVNVLIARALIVDDEIGVPADQMQTTADHMQTVVVEAP
jgi:hypothetical protein